MAMRRLWLGDVVNRIMIEDRTLRHLEGSPSV